MIENLLGGGSSFFYFILLLGICVLVHEWGHYIVAILCGIRVEVFSIGFGKPLFSWKRGDTEYVLAPIPMGGYVKMAGDNPEEANPENSWEFFSAPIWKRCLVVLAGPAMNIITALVVFFFILMFYGERYNPSVVGYVYAGGAADLAGLKMHDRIIDVNGTAVSRDDELARALADVYDGTGDGTVTLTVERGGERLPLTLDFAHRFKSGPFTLPEDFEIGPEEDTPAAKIGLKAGDMLLEADGVPLPTVAAAVEALGSKFKLTGETAPDADGKIVASGAEPVPFILKWKTAEGEVKEAEVTPDVSPAPDRKAGYRSLIGVPVPLNMDGRCGVLNGNAENPVGSPNAQLLGFSLLHPPIVNNSFQMSAARKLGLGHGDRIVTLDGKETPEIADVQEIISGKCETKEDGQVVASEVKVGWVTADGEAREGTVTVDLQKLAESEESSNYVTLGYLGIDFMQPVRPIGPAEAFVGSFLRVGGSVKQMQAFITRIFTGQASSRHLGGPIEIFRQAGNFGRQGWKRFFDLVGLISISLAIFNLFPIPILDGGHLLIFGIEKIKRIFTREGLSIGQLMFFQKIGMAILLPLILFIFYNDFARMDVFGKIVRFGKNILFQQ